MSATVRWALLGLLLAGGMAGGAQFIEHVLKQDPCPLCLMQRIWVLLAGSVVLVALCDGLNRRAYPLALFACSAIGGGFSLRQLWLQSLPPEAVPSCGPDMGYMLEVFPASDVLKAMILGTGNCAEVGWTLFGVGLAAWALAGFVALATCAVLWWIAQGHRRRI